MESFDYVIVGAGSAGSALAARLSEDPGISVLLLEAGPRGRHPWIHIPMGYGKVFYDRRFNWRYETEPDPGLNGRAMYWPRGKVLGGSSAINAMVWVRGHPADFDRWDVPGWSWGDVEPVFRRIEDWRGAPDDLRGRGGPLTVCGMEDGIHGLTRTYLTAAEEAGIDRNPDYNAARMEGAFTYQITVRDGIRASAAEAYLRPATRRPNLKVRTGAMATSIVFEGRRATGIEYRVWGRPYRATARREVILCGGAINTPQLLQLSGVGPGGLLKTHGIEVVLDAPEVGQNLTDHLCVDILFGATRPSMNQALRPLIGKIRAGLRYLARRNGPLAMSLNQGGGFYRLSPGEGPPDLQLYFSPLTYARAPAGTRPLLQPDPFPAFRMGFNPCKPTSRGSLSIRSRNPAEAPEMRANYLSTEEDRAMMVAGSRLVRRIAGAPALSAVIEREMVPGAEIDSDEGLLENARTDGWTVFHQCGTCRMGRDAGGAVVDPRLRVFGIEGLRIADASIFPEIPSGNTNAPAMMVGERAADIIREDARGARP